MASFYHIHVRPKKDVTREQIEKVLDLAIDWFRYHQRNWIVYTKSDAKTWSSRLEQFVKPDGYLVIVKLDMSDYWGFASKRLWKWIEERF